MAVVFQEQHGSPSEGLTHDGDFTATRRLVCAWAERLVLIQELVGGAYAEDWANSTLYTVGDLKRDILVPSSWICLVGHTSAAGPTTFAQDRTANPTYWLSVGSGAIALTVGATPFKAEQKGSDDVAAYEKALITVEYGPPKGGAPPEDVEGVLMSESLEPTAEFLTEDYTQFQWGSGATGIPLKENEAPGRLMRGLDYVVTLHQVTTLPASTLSHVGFVNSVAISPKTVGLTGLTFAIETLLYQPPTIQRVITTEGAKKWTVTKRYTYKPNWDGANARGWNWFWRAETGIYEQLYLKGTDTVRKPYSSVAF